jgi:hypothetical protein
MKPERKVVDRYELEERAAILEYDAHLPRAEAERRARAEFYGPEQMTLKGSER